MNALTKALDNSRGFVATVEAWARQAKSTGGLSDLVVPSTGGISAVSGLGSSSSGARRYNEFRDWLYSAVHALASEAAGQPVMMGRVIGQEAMELDDEDERRMLARIKSWTRAASRKRTKTAGQEFEAILAHPILDLLEHPNPVQHRWQFVYTFVANLNLTGWAYVVASEDEEGKLQFWSLPSTWVTPIHDKGPFAEFRVSDPRNPQLGDNEEDRLTREQVAFAYLPNPGNPIGALPPSTSQSAAIQIDSKIQESQRVFFENGIFPSVIVSVGREPHPDVPGGVRPRLTAPQRRQVVGAIRKTMTGVHNYGHPAIVDGMIESIERLSATQNEMGWDRSEEKVRTRILSAFGVHPYILGEPVNVGGYAQAAKIEERFAKRVNTFLDMLSTVMTTFVDRIIADPVVVWWEPAAPHDPALHWQNLREARKNGDITRNEFRAELGFPPDEEMTDRNKLLDSVGGMTGAVQIMNAVGQGLVSRESAARMFELFFQIDAKTAGAIAGAGGSEQQALQDATEDLRAAMRMLRVRPEAVGAFLAEAAK